MASGCQDGGEDGGVKGRDPAWKYCQSVPTNKQTTICKFCQLMIMSGGITRFKYHLSHTDPQKNTRPCKNVPPEVKKEIRDQLRAKEIGKGKKSAKMDDIMVELQRGLHEDEDEIVHSNELYVVRLFEEKRPKKKTLILKDKAPSELAKTSDVEASQVTTISSPVDLAGKRAAMESSDAPPLKRLQDIDFQASCLSQGLARFVDIAKYMEDLNRDQATRLEKFETILAEEKKKRQGAKAQAAQTLKEKKALEQKVKNLEERLARQIELEQKVVASQGDLLRTFLKKLIMTNQFSRFISDCGKAMLVRTRTGTLKKVPADHPNLPLADEKYGSDEMSVEEMNEPYMSIAIDPPEFPFLEHLASYEHLLTPSFVTECTVDEDEEFVSYQKKLAEVGGEVLQGQSSSSSQLPADPSNADADKGHEVN